MRKLFTLATALVVSSTMMAQQTIPFHGTVKSHTIAPEPTEQMLNSHKTSPNTGGATDLSTQAVTKLLSLPNAYGYGAARAQKQLTALPNQNAVVAVNRQSPTVYGEGTSGNLRYVISTNQGDTWTDGIQIGGMINTNAAANGPARYPNAILFQNGGSTAADLKLHVVSPTVDAASGSGWTFQNRLTVQDPTTINAYTSQEDYDLGGTEIFYSTGNITERVHGSGEFWMVCSSSNTSDENMYIFKGAYDATALKLNWALVDTLITDWNINVDAATHWTMGAIAFSPDGSKGYVAVLGDLTGGRDSAYAPIFYDFNGSTFGNAYEVDINIPQLSAYVQQWVDSAGTPLSDGKITCSFNFDMNVDMNGDPHFFTIVGPAASTQPYSISSGFGMRMMDIHQFQGDWYATEIGPQRTFRETLGTAPDDLPVDPTPGISRTVDGKYLFYTWTDTDTTGVGGNDNTSPDMWGRMMDVSTSMMTDSINWTLSDPNWHTKARIAKTSEYVFQNATTSSCGKEFEVPTTIMNFTDPTNVLTTCEIYYFSDIIYKCEDAIRPATTVAIQPASIGVNNLKAFPNPAKNVLNVQMNLSNMETVSISLVNMNGQTVLNKVVNNTSDVSEQFNVANLASGLYFLQVTTSKGTQSQKVLVN